MNIKTLLSEGRERLQEGDSPYLDALVLFAHVVALSREQIYARLDDDVDSTTATRFRDAVERRSRGEPVAYITGRKEFWGLDFEVGEGVLIPRPDTETLVEAALAFMKDRNAPRVHDLCTGSGAVAIALATERPDARVSMSDLSEDALSYATRNKRRHSGSVQSFHGDLWEGVPGRFDIVTANPPYITEAEYEDMKRRAWREPGIALVSGTDGLDLIRRLIKETREHMAPKGVLLIESSINQVVPVGNIMIAHGFSDIREWRDLSDRPRVCSGVWDRDET